MKRMALAALLVGLVQWLPSAADAQLLEAIRASDRATVTRLLQSGADPNVRDGTGTTQLSSSNSRGAIQLSSASA